MKPIVTLPLRSYRNLALIALLLLISCATTFGQANSGAPDPIEGKWYGVTGFPTDRVELGFEFKRNERHELKAYLYAPVVNFYGLELPGNDTAWGKPITGKMVETFDHRPKRCRYSLELIKALTISALTKSPLKLFSSFNQTG